VPLKRRARDGDWEHAPASRRGPKEGTHTMNTTKHSGTSLARTTRVLGQAGRGIAAAALVALACASGCGRGHGEYTKAHLNAAKIKMQGMKAATEFDMAKQAYLAGDLKKALKHVDYSIELSERVCKSHVLRGRILLEMGDMQNCSIALSNARDLDITNPEAHYYSGIMCERVDKMEDALAFYRAAMTHDTANPQYALASAEVLIDLDRVDEAEALVIEARSNFEHHAGMQQILGHIAMMRGDAEGAVAFFQSARLLAPDDQAMLEDLIHAQVATGRVAEAENNLDRLLTGEDFKARRDLKHLRATCLVQLDRPVDARDLLLELTRDQAGSADFDAWIGLGEVSYELRDQSRARIAAARAIAISPNRPEGYVLRAMNLRRLGEYAQAITNLETAADISPDAETYVIMGLVYQDMQQPEDARRCFETALQVDPEDVAATHLLAGVQATE
jgi:tetratricopeptide (TPR) repeat protein